MADEPSESNGNSDYKNLARVLGLAAASVSILVGINSLTGFNPFNRFAHLPSTSIQLPTPRPTPTPLSTPVWIPTRIPETTTTVPMPPDFVVAHEQWSGPCDYGCGMSAIFHNIGGEGAEAATFYVMPNDGTYAYLAYCSAIIPSTVHGGVVTTGCTAYSSNLDGYFKSHPGATVTMLVKVSKY